jgi:hypothetical protein
MIVPWTLERVRAEMVAAARQKPASALVVSSKGEFIQALTGGGAIEWDIVAAADYFVLDHPAPGQDSDDAKRDWKMLMEWARITALHQGQDTDVSLAEMCRERGWNRSTFKRRVGATVQRVGDGLENARTGIVAVKRLQQQARAFPKAADVI